MNGSASSPLASALGPLASLDALFRLFLAGRHLNRVADPALWAELERHEADYTLLFSSLGYTLRVDHRGFAWFHTPSASAPINRISRQLALLFMVIFDTQANAGQTLQRFSDWLVTRELLAETHKQHQDMLEAEGLDTEGLRELFDRAAGLGFAQRDGAGWRLLPAVYRYLDHFQALAADERHDTPDASFGLSGNADDVRVDAGDAASTEADDLSGQASARRKPSFIDNDSAAGDGPSPSDDATDTGDEVMTDEDDLSSDDTPTSEHTPTKDAPDTDTGETR